jgi:hypothetical protein
METITREYKVYKFEELEESAQQKALEKLSDINVDYDWWDCEVDYFQSDKLKEIGFEDAKIQFSGFCSQGDGACFDARINLEKIIKHLNDKRFNRLLPLIKEGYVSMAIERNSFGYHYSHERTRYVSLSCDLSEKYTRLNRLASLLLDYVEELRLDLSHEIYTSLEKDYYYLTSEEAIKETIEANEYTFLESGKIFS